MKFTTLFLAGFFAMHMGAITAIDPDDVNCVGTCTPETYVVPDFPNCKCWSLTDEETWGSKHGQAGAVWFNDTSLDPASTETSIEASAYLRFSTKTGHLDGLKDIFGGDGIAFVIHTEPEGVDYVPDDHCEGDDLGFKCLDNYVAVEFDTRDCLTDKIRIHTKKSGEDPVVEQWDPGCNFIQLEDGAFRYVRVKVDEPEIDGGTPKLYVWLAKEISAEPFEKIPLDLTDIFGVHTPIYFGFVAATSTYSGGFWTWKPPNNQHMICLPEAGTFDSGFCFDVAPQRGGEQGTFQFTSTNPTTVKVMLDIDPVHYPGDDKCAIDKKLEATVLGPTCSEEAVEGSSAFLVSVVPAETAPFDEAELVIEIDTALLQEGDYYFPATGLDDCYAELQLCTQVDYIYTGGDWCGPNVGCIPHDKSMQHIYVQVYLTIDVCNDFHIIYIDVEDSAEGGSVFKDGEIECEIKAYRCETDICASCNLKPNQSHLPLIEGDPLEFCVEIDEENCPEGVEILDVVDVKISQPDGDTGLTIQAIHNSSATLLTHEGSKHGIHWVLTQLPRHFFTLPNTAYDLKVEGKVKLSLPDTWGGSRQLLELAGSDDDAPEFKDQRKLNALSNVDLEVKVARQDTMRMCKSKVNKSNGCQGKKRAFQKSLQACALSSDAKKRITRNAVCAKPKGKKTGKAKKGKAKKGAKKAKAKKAKAKKAKAKAKAKKAKKAKVRKGRKPNV